MRPTTTEQTTGGVDPFSVGEIAQTTELRDGSAVERIERPSVGGVTVTRTEGRSTDFAPLVDRGDPSSAALIEPTAPPVRSYVMTPAERERLEVAAAERGVTLVELLREQAR